MLALLVALGDIKFVTEPHRFHLVNLHLDLSAGS